MPPAAGAGCPSGAADGWSEYQRLVLAELERHNRNIERLQADLAELKAEIATRNELQALKEEFARYKADQGAEMAVLKTKAGGWGALAGALAALVPILMAFLFQILLRKP